MLSDPYDVPLPKQNTGSPSKEFHSNGLEDFTNCWIAPGYNSMKMADELTRQVNSHGGPVEQAYLYIDLQSASDWRAIANNEEYLTTLDDIPLEHAAAAIKRRLQQSPQLDQTAIDIISLGPGDARSEVQLARRLLKHIPLKNLRLFLLDISFPLMNNAYDYASSTVGKEPGVFVKGVAGDFYLLNRYHELLNLSKKMHRLCMLTMFGHTFGNLKNERRFVKESLNAFPSGTLLLTDVGLVLAPAKDEKEVQRKDPWLSGKSRWREITERFLEGPLRRYRRGLREADKVLFYPELDYSLCSIANSYCVEIKAIVPPDIHFSMRYFKRYDLNSLLESMETDGWNSIDGWRFSEDKLLHLFYRK